MPVELLRGGVRASGPHPSSAGRTEGEGEMSSTRSKVERLEQQRKAAEGEQRLAVVDAVGKPAEQVQGELAALSATLPAGSRVLVVDR